MMKKKQYRSRKSDEVCHYKFMSVNDSRMVRVICEYPYSLV
jgi:hypothetical protein